MIGSKHVVKIGKIKYQCPHDSFRTQGIKTKDRQSIMIWAMCHVKGWSTQLATLTSICLQ